MSDLKADILDSDDLKIEKVAVPEWPKVNGHLYVKVMTGTARDAFESAFVKGGSVLINVRAKLAARTLCDSDGKLVFTDADIPALGQKSAAALDRVFASAQRLNGIGEADVEALAKNSEAAQSGNFGSDSPSSSDTQSENSNDE